jgi:hypothetical protein
VLLAFLLFFGVCTLLNGNPPTTTVTAFGPLPTCDRYEEIASVFSPHCEVTEVLSLLPPAIPTKSVDICTWPSDLILYHPQSQITNLVRKIKRKKTQKKIKCAIWWRKS